MIIQFYKNDLPGSGLVFQKGLVEFDNVRMIACISALPAAMKALLRKLPRLPHNENNDYEADRIHREALNEVIRLADLLIELLDVVMTHKTIIDMYSNEDVTWSAIVALRRLQDAKEARIKITHRDLGEHFGSAMGFQTINYDVYAQRIADWLRTVIGEKQT